MSLQLEAQCQGQARIIRSDQPVAIKTHVFNRWTVNMQGPAPAPPSCVYFVFGSVVQQLKAQSTRGGCLIFFSCIVRHQLGVSPSMFVVCPPHCRVTSSRADFHHGMSLNLAMKFGFLISVFVVFGVYPNSVPVIINNYQSTCQRILMGFLFLFAS